MNKTLVCLAGLFLFGCDCGVQSGGASRPFAVGTVAPISFGDFCTTDIKEKSLTLLHCTDEMVTGVQSATVGAPFEVISTSATGVVVKVNGVGKATLVVDLILTGGTLRQFTVPLEGRKIDRLDVQNTCQLTKAPPLATVVGQPIVLTYLPRGGGSALTSTEAPMPFVLDGLQVESHSGSRSGGGGNLKVSGTKAGTARLTSAEDTRLNLPIEVFDPADVAITWKPVSPFIRLLEGFTGLTVTTAAGADGGADGGRGLPLCDLPGTWTATVQSPGICEVNNQGSGPYGGTAKLMPGYVPSFSVRGRDAGMCVIDVRDEAGTWVSSIQISCS